MLFLKILLIAVGLVALSAGVILGEFYLVKKKNAFYGLIPSAALSLVSYLTLLIMVIAGAGWKANLITFFLLQIPIVAGVGAMIYLRRRYLQKQAEERAREMRLQNARRMENEKQARMNFLLKGFRCAESGMKVEGQREIVTLSKSGKNTAEIVKMTGASEQEVERILTAFEKYINRVDTDEPTATDRILTEEQEQSIVNYLVNSTPAEQNLSASMLWNRTTARMLASNLLDSNLSGRMMSAYLAHWGLTVPEKQAIRSRSSQPEVRMWLAGEYEQIRKTASDKGGELIWIYTVIPEKIKDISMYVPKNPIMLCAVSVEGSVAFRVYDKDMGGYFTDFVASLTTLPGNKLFAIVNENYDEYMKTLGKDRKRALTDRIEFFKGV